jgi:hypothetical protein
LDLKANCWEDNTRYHIPAMGFEVYLQTTLGSRALAAGTQPSLNLLFDQSLPLGLDLEYNFGMTGVQNGQGQITYQFSYQWSLRREVVEDFDVFSVSVPPRRRHRPSRAATAGPSAGMPSSDWSPATSAAQKSAALR